MHILKLKFIPVMAKLNYVSHDPSKIILICWFGAQQTFLIIINAENDCAA